MHTCRLVLGPYYSLAYCFIHIADISVYWVVGEIGIKLMQQHTLKKKAGSHNWAFHSTQLTTCREMKLELHICKICTPIILWFICL